MTSEPNTEALRELKRMRNSLDEWVAKAADNDMTHMSVSVEWLKRFYKIADEAAAALAALHAERAGLREALTDAVVRWEALSRVPISGQSVTLIACANEMREILAHEQEKFALCPAPPSVAGKETT